MVRILARISALVAGWGVIAVLLASLLYDKGDKSAYPALCAGSIAATVLFMLGFGIIFWNHTENK